MKNFNELCDELLEEAKLPYKTKTKEKTKLADLFQRIESEVGGKEVTKAGVKPDITKATKLKTADLAKTRQKTADITPTPEIGDKLASMDITALANDDAEDTDEAGYEPTEVTPTTLPDVVSNAIVGEEDLRPEFHMVKNLPGYIQAPIRQAGKQIFKAFTTVPIEQINVIANVADQGPNEQRELNAVASYLDAHGIRNGQAEIEFEDFIPDYKADVKFYNAHDITFMVVRDFAGNYIYSWPEATDKIASSGTAGELTEAITDDVDLDLVEQFRMDFYKFLKENYYQEKDKLGDAWNFARDFHQKLVHIIQSNK